MVILVRNQETKGRGRGGPLPRRFDAARAPARARGQAAPWAGPTTLRAQRAGRQQALSRHRKEKPRSKSGAKDGAGTSIGLFFARANLKNARPSLQTIKTATLPAQGTRSASAHCPRLIHKTESCSPRGSLCLAPRRSASARGAAAGVHSTRCGRGPGFAEKRK